MERLWSRRADLFGDIQSGAAVHHALVDRIRVPGEGNEWVNIEITQAILDLVYDGDSPGGLRSPATVTDEELSQAGVRREHVEYWVASERIAGVDLGAHVHELIPDHRYPAPPNPLAPVRARRCTGRARARGRRARRTVRAPSDPSRPRPSQLAATRPAGCSA